MRLSSHCEAEGCALKAKWLVVDYGKSWGWLACDDHEAAKKPEELSAPLPEQPEE